MHKWSHSDMILMVLLMMATTIFALVCITLGFVMADRQNGTTSTTTSTTPSTSQTVPSTDPTTPSTTPATPDKSTQTSKPTQSPISTNSNTNPTQPDQSEEASPKIVEVATPVEVPPPTGRLKWHSYIQNLHTSKFPKVDPYLVEAIIERESNWDEYALNPSSGTVGLMQLAPKYFKGLAEEYYVEDITDPRSNILLGMAYLQNLFTDYEDPKLVLMLYNMKWSKAFELYNDGITSDYALTRLERAEELRKEDSNAQN